MTATTQRLSAEEIVRVRETHSLVGVLRHAGVQPPHGWDRTSDFKISCPVPQHRDSDPSCVIHPQTNRWHCFGCSAGGDVFALVRAVEGVSSLVAIAKFLDQGRPLTIRAEGERVRSATSTERPDPQRTSRERVLAINEAAWRYYTEPVLAHRAQRYLRRRGIDVTALEQEIGRPVAGSTPYQRAGLVDHLHAHGVTAEELVDAAWASRRPDEPPADRYRHRLLIPARDLHDRVVGVYGRDLTNRATSKYLNTAETAVFHKGAVLYRPSAPQLDAQATVIVCEGSLDALAIAAAAAGVGRSRYFAPVAPSGTALTDAHVRRLLALHPAAPLVCADGDSPGRVASTAWVARILAAGRECVVTVLPSEHDPVSWLQAHGQAGLRAFVRKGCLSAAGDDLRPVHVGAFLAATLLDASAGAAPSALPDVVGTLARSAVRLRGDAVRRYAAAAAAILARRGFGPEQALARLLGGTIVDARADAARTGPQRAVEWQPDISLGA